MALDEASPSVRQRLSGDSDGVMMMVRWLGRGLFEEHQIALVHIGRRFIGRRVEPLKHGLGGLRGLGWLWGWLASQSWRRDYGHRAYDPQHYPDYQSSRHEIFFLTIIPSEK